MKKTYEKIFTVEEQQKLKAFIKILNSHRITNPEKELLPCLKNCINLESYLSIISYCYESDNMDLCESCASFVESYVTLLKNFEKHLGGETNE